MQIKLKALRPVQFLTSFISFYFKILSYLAYGEKMIILASENSVKLGKKLISSLFDRLQDSLFLLTHYIHTCINMGTPSLTPKYLSPSWVTLTMLFLSPVNNLSCKSLGKRLHVITVLMINFSHNRNDVYFRSHLLTTVLSSRVQT